MVAPSRLSASQNLGADAGLHEVPGADGDQRAGEALEVVTPERRFAVDRLDGDVDVPLPLLAAATVVVSVSPPSSVSSVSVASVAVVSSPPAERATTAPAVTSTDSTGVRRMAGPSEGRHRRRRYAVGGRERGQPPIRSLNPGQAPATSLKGATAASSETASGSMIESAMKS